MIKTRLTVKKSSIDDKGNPAPTGFFDMAKIILKEEGILGFFKGLGPSLILVMNPIIQYTAFEKLKTYFEKWFPTLNALHFFALGALSKLAATGTTYPYMYVLLF